MDRARAPRNPGDQALRDGFWEFAGRAGAGVIRASPGALRLGPVPLLRFGPAEKTGSGWRWPITGGVLARRPGGLLSFEWRDGELEGAVEGYRPALPAALYRVTQLPVHHLVTRLFLLHLRGRLPAPGVPAEPWRRLAAGSADLALCAAAGRLLRLRPGTALALACLVQAACWTAAGRTPAGALLGLRVVSVDGLPVEAGQSLLRALAAPAALVCRRAAHDELAATEVVRA